jgi:hypothetical protein
MLWHRSPLLPRCRPRPKACRRLRRKPAPSLRFRFLQAPPAVPLRRRFFLTGLICSTSCSKAKNPRRKRGFLAEKDDRRRSWEGSVFHQRPAGKLEPIARKSSRQNFEQRARLCIHLLRASRLASDGRAQPGIGGMDYWHQPSTKHDLAV